ncbi:two-component regulator propeller domain-containing protein [Aliikangiella maris]|uniref:histidine kinase n=2 Tax=Aliikangiella maris TaxID=3162458 RepID=A0ABV2BWD9_9GAMM
MFAWCVIRLTIGSAYAFNRFDRYQLEQGLSQNTVNCILQDHFGFIWIGTQDGLNRFDGYQFVAFQDDNNSPTAISDDFITALLLTRNNELWVGTRSGGLNQFHFQTESFSHYRQSTQTGMKSSDRISSMIEIDDNEFWIGTSGGINRFAKKSGRFSLVSTKFDDKQLVVSQLFQDSSGAIWVATDHNGIIKFTGDNFQHIDYYNTRNTPTLLSDKINHFFQDSRGYLWIATDKGINRIALTGQLVNQHSVANKSQLLVFEQFFYDDDTTSVQNGRAVRDFAEAEDGSVWIATENGLSQFQPDNRQFMHLAHDPSDEYSIGGNSINTIFISEDNVIWLGLFSRGLNKFAINTKHFQHFKQNPYDPNSLSKNNVWTFAEKNPHEIWVGTDGGGVNLFHTKSQRFTHYKHDPKNKNSLSDNRVWAVLQTTPDELWVGTYASGLNRINLITNQVVHMRHDKNDVSTLSDDRIIHLYQDSQKNIWVGTRNGLNRFDEKNNRFVRYFHESDNENSLSGNFILNFIEDKKGQFWISTYDAGVTHFDPRRQQFTRFRYMPNNSNSISNDKVMYTMVASDGMIWVATYGGGINRIDPLSGLIRRFDKRHGLNNNSVYALLEDSKGYIWLSSNSGISMFDPVAESFTHFSLSSGLQSSEFNSGAYLKASDGYFYFGGVNGFNRFLPEAIKSADVNLNVILTQLKIFNQTVDVAVNSEQLQSPEKYHLKKAIYLTDEITLTHKESLVSFEFSSLNYNYANEIIYQYQLEGFDEDWITAGNNARNATYTSLPPGKYRLKLRARVGQSPWGIASDTLVVKVKAAPWRSGWAYFIYVMLPLSIILAFVYQRLQQYKQLSKSEARLAFSLWGSRNQLWDWDLQTSTIIFSSGKSQIREEQQVEHFDLFALKNVVHPDDFQQVESLFEQHIHDKTAYLDVIYRRKNNAKQWHWYRARGRAVSRQKDGLANRIVGTLEDVDELVNAQHELKQLNEKLEFRVQQRTAELSTTLKELKATQKQLVESEKIASLVGLVSGVAHELNTPLGIMLTAISHIEENFSRLLGKLHHQAQLTEELQSIEHSCLKGFQLVNQSINKSIRLVQNFKSLSMHDNVDKPEEFYLKFHIEQVVQLLKVQNHADQLAVHIRQSADIQINTFKDSVAIVIEELIENSILHSSLSIDQLNIQITFTVKDDWVELIYIDNGKGVTAEDYEKVFEPFFTTRRSSECSGLGLTIIYNHITQKLNGTIRLDKNIKHGVKMVIAFPKYSQSE